MFSNKNESIPMDICDSPEEVLIKCNFCNRKPGFFSGGINYCYVHWFDNKNKSTNL